MKINPDVKTIFRSHIHIDTSLFSEGSPQIDTWSFVWDENRIKDCDVFISHPDIVTSFHGQYNALNALQQADATI